MPHDKHGRLISVGDTVKTPVEYPNRVVVGPIMNISESDTCSGQVKHPVLGGMAETMFNAKDSELVLMADGSEPVDVSVPLEKAPENETCPDETGHL